MKSKKKSIRFLTNGCRNKYHNEQKSKNGKAKYIYTHLGLLRTIMNQIFMISSPILKAMFH